jgi:hypothetical protein
MAVPPEPWGGLKGRTASTFICWEPPAIAICSLPQEGRSKSTRASGCERYCTVMAPLGPLRRESYLVAAVR